MKPSPMKSSPMKRMTEWRAFHISGFFAFLLGWVVIIWSIWQVWQKLGAVNFDIATILGNWQSLGIPFLAFLAGWILLSGLFINQPNEAKVLTFFGRYVGSVKGGGFHWTNPWASKKAISLKVRNFHSQTLKVNDSQGNPIEIAAVVVWRVIDTARAMFDVESYEKFVDIQAETAIRALASHYPYDAPDGGASLLHNSDEVGEALKDELHKRLEVAGVDVLESRISHLAYAPEIAQSMLRRQQAQAVIAARQKIVEGAVGMVKMALQQLSSEGIVTLNEERKASMVNNLLVALVSESEVQPMISTSNV
jgi:regulator of protease activity HflC (stomatin/prohibitin superfamily)